ncbi:MAG TPA: PAS domain S-box protein [Alphaproteobacteria bacterium]|nr:PAS domain S-box protein [Alphaproteobacteria bacterium]
MTEPYGLRLSRSGGRSGVAVAALGCLGVALAAAALVILIGGTGDKVAAALASGGGVAGLGALALQAVEWRRAATEGEKLRLLLQTFDGTMAAHLVSAPGGRVVHATAAANKLFDVPAVDTLAVVEDVLAGDAKALKRFQRLRRAVEGGAPFSVDLAHARKSGGQSWWLISARPLDGWPGCVHWRIEDVTTRREMEAILREEQVKRVDFMDHAPVGFYSVDQDGRFLFANATLADWFGVDARELVRGRHVLHEFLVDRPVDSPSYALVQDGADRSHVDVPMRDVKGRVFQASVAQTVVHGDDGRSVWTRSVVRDLTPERQMREALRVSEARFQRFFEDAPIGIVLLDGNAAIDEWNAAFEELVGQSGADLHGRPIADFLVERIGAATVARLSEVLTGGEAAQDSGAPIDVRIQGAPERGELSASLYVRRLEGGFGEDPGLILQFIDQTEQKNLEMQFAQSQKMQAVGQLAGGIAHDFNNLLTAMIGFCDLLLLRHKPGDASFGDIMQIKQNANRAANLVRQLLAFSRQQTLQPRVLNITDVLAELSNLLRRLIGENIELKMIHGRDLGLVRVDQGQLEQVIINLAVNARDAMLSGNGGRLTIATFNRSSQSPLRSGTDEIPPGDYVAIEVNDTGVGIPPDNINRIFEPFFSTKEVGSGTGLGLSTVYGIVRQTGGYIFVDSAPGQGATFTIYLPRHEPQAAAEPAALEFTDAVARDLTGAGCILLVEDEDPVRVFSARALRNKGYEVLEAKSGEAALAVLAEEADRIDLLVTDVVMPQMDGPTLIRKVRETHPDMKVICISGYTEDRFRRNLDDGDAIHFLPKPFSLKQLASKVKDVIRPGG